MDYVEYRRPSIDSVRSVRFRRTMKIMHDDGVRSMFSIFGQYSTRGLIELDASLVGSIEQAENFCKLRAKLGVVDDLD